MSMEYSASRISVGMRRLLRLQLRRRAFSIGSERDGTDEKKEVRARIEDIGIVPAIRLSCAADALFAADAIVDSGIPIIHAYRRGGASPITGWIDKE
jgi:hypothetical protein